MTQINTYDIGDRPRLEVTFKDLTGALADPTAVTAKVKDPANVVTDYNAVAVQHASLGVYYIDVDLDQSGTWFYRFDGVGTVKASVENAFNVRESRF